MTKNTVANCEILQISKVMYFDSCLSNITFGSKNFFFAIFNFYDVVFHTKSMFYIRFHMYDKIII